MEGIVEAVSVQHLGIKLANGNWINIKPATEEEKISYQKALSELRKGTKIKIVETDGKISWVVLEQPYERDDDIVSYDELLKQAHNSIKSIHVSLPIVDMEKKFAVAFCRIKTIDGKEFEDFGDATQDNCGENIKKHFVRMAVTRAKARALRNMVCGGLVVEEVD